MAASIQKFALPIETPTKPSKSSDSQHSSHPPLNERILSSMTRKSVAAHPRPDLENGSSKIYCRLDGGFILPDLESWIPNLPNYSPYNGTRNPLIQPLHEAGGSSGTVNDRAAAYYVIITAGRTEVEALENHPRTVWLTSLLSNNANNGARGRRFDHNIVAAIDNLNCSLKEISDFFKGNRELARDDPTWFKTLIAINGGSITALIYKSIANNNRNSVPTEIIESYAACCAVVGFCASIAGLHLSTNKPKSLPFGCDPEVSTQKMGIVGGLATAFGFMAGVLLLLPNNLFRGITMGAAFVAFTIPIFFKLRPSSESRPDVPLPVTNTDVSFF